MNRARRLALAAVLIAAVPALPARAQQIVDLDAGREEWYLATRDGKSRLYVYETGRGEPVIVLHGGFGAEHGYMLDALAGLEDDHHFVLYDQRGSLRSPCAAADVSLERHVDDLEELRAELGLERIDVLAHSAGTLLALAYLERHPQRVGRLVLVSLAQPKSSLAPADFPGGAYPEGFSTAVQRFQAFAARPAIQEEIELWDLAKSALSQKEESRLWRIRFAAANVYHIERWTRLKGGQVFYSQAAANAASSSMPRPYDFLPALAAAEAPVTVVMGDHDFLDFGGAIYPALFSALEHVEVVRIDEAGHNVWIDQPEAFRKAAGAALVR